VPESPARATASLYNSRQKTTPVPVRVDCSTAWKLAISRRVYQKPAHHDDVDEAADDIERSVVLEVADWAVIGGTMDNEIQDLRDKQWYDSAAPDQLNPYWVEMTDLAEGIRQAGWDQLTDWPKTYEELQAWPPPGMTQAMRLNARQWGLVVSTLERWATINAADEPSSKAAGLRIATSIRKRFNEEGYAKLPAVRPAW
jgi:hypothetical protein